MSLIGEGHTMMGNELFDSIGKDLPMNVLGNSEYHWAEAQMVDRDSY